MNKKYLIFGLLGIFAIGIVSAIAYYAVFSASFNVVSAISISDCSDELGEVFSGETIVGSECIITNNAPSERVISISNDAPEDVSVSYMSFLTLTEKTVDFNADVWNVPEDAEEVIVKYTLVGNEFTATVENPISGYTLVYYKDNEDRFNNPATVIGVDEVIGNLPNEDDANMVNDYSVEYPTTPHGAKIWYVPSDAVNGDNTINWNLANQFYFETKLIQYNSDGIIILYGESEIAITPIYSIGAYSNGAYIITTQIA